MNTDLSARAARVFPSERQARFMRKPFYAFVHFSPNTYTGKEWGDGTENPAIFNPTELDCDQWVEAIKSAGMTGMVLTAKHHDGFCLWQSRYTEHSVKNSPWKNGKGDVVREAAEACRRGGIRFGVYLSPWDRNCALYGTDAYNDYYKKQLTELLTEYGELFYVWFDGACGEGPNGRKQTYDFEGYIDLIRKYQPNACVFNDAGPDIRWIGNESGRARYEEWAVVPHELCFRAEKQVSLEPEGTLPHIYNTWQDLGSTSILRHSAGLSFCPAEVDMSIRPGWFYHPSEEPHSLKRLMDTYLTSVGGNASFNLNIPPMPNGRFDERDVARLKELGSAIRDLYREELPIRVERERLNDAQCVYHISFPAETEFRHVALSEDMSKGQRVERFHISSGSYPFYQGTTVGFRKICPVGAVRAKEFDVTVLSARADACLKVKVYA